MSETTNYGLYITDDNTERFQDWRRKMSGVSDSNMIKLDTALAGKADNSITVSTSLTASGWSAGEAPSQEITVDGLTADHNGMIFVSNDATTDQREAARKAALSVVGQVDGTLTIVADGDVPEIDIPVCITLIG